MHRRVLGARLHRRNMGDITTTPQKRMHSKSLRYEGADALMYGYPTHKTDLQAHAHRLVKSKSDLLIEQGSEVSNRISLV